MSLFDNYGNLNTKELARQHQELQKEFANLRHKLVAMGQEQKTMKQDVQCVQEKLKDISYKESIFQRIQCSAKYFLGHEKNTDCSFLVGIHPTQTLVKAHKLVLGMASNVFQAILYGNEKKNEDPIEVTDINPSTFKAVLTYIYSMDIQAIMTDNITPEEVCCLHFAAIKYQLPSELPGACVDFLKKNVNPLNACRIYEYSKRMILPNLEKKCMNVIIMNTQEVFNSPEWCGIEFSTLLHILDQDKLKISSEVDVFNAVGIYFASRSTATQNNDKDVVDTQKNNLTEKDVGIPLEKKIVMRLSDADEALFKKALEKIRFLTMTAGEFVEGPYSSGIFSDSYGSGILAAISKESSIDLWYPTSLCRSISSRFE